MANQSVFSFCVKCMRPEVTEEVIRNTLRDIGEINYIDLVQKNSPLPDDPSKFYMMAFIHMKSWSNALSDNLVRQTFIDKVRSDVGVNFVYDEDGHYIVLRENHNPNRSSGSDWFNDNQNYIAKLEQENAQFKHAAITNFNNLHNMRCQYDELTTQIQEMRALNQQLTIHNNTLQQQVAFLTSQYIPTAFPPTNYNPSAPPYVPQYESDVDTQISDSNF